MSATFKTVLLFIVVACFQLTSFAQVQIGGDIDGGVQGEQFGYSISMSDAQTIAIGDRFNSQKGMWAGSVHVYRWISGGWVQKGLRIDGDYAMDESGCSVSMADSNTIAIGSRFNSKNGVRAGQVRIYRWDGVRWVQKGGSLYGALGGDNFGWSVNMSDSNTVAIGANSGGNTNNSGYFSVYRWNGDVWKQKGVNVEGDSAGDNYGYSISMPDSNTVAVGAPYNDRNGVGAGHVQIYQWNDSNWVQKGVSLEGDSAGDSFGYSISMSNSNTLAVGAPNNNNRSGHVRIFNWNGATWMKKGKDIKGEADYDLFGSSVSMSDSNTLAIGAPDNDGNGINTGHVRVFRWNGSAWMNQFGAIYGNAETPHFGWATSMIDTNVIAISTIVGKRVKVYSLCSTSDTFNLTDCKNYLSPSGKIWTTSGQYKDTLVNVVGCDSIITINLTIDTINTTVSISGDSLIANDTNATYQWLNCEDSLVVISGAINRFFTPSESSGSYAVVLEKINCVDTSECVSITGLFDHNNQRETITIYPNPSNGLFTIEYPFTNESKVYTVSDINGKVVREGVINKEKSQLNLSEFVSGIYLLRIEDTVVKLVLN